MLSDSAHDCQTLTHGMRPQKSQSGALAVVGGLGEKLVLPPLRGVIGGGALDGFLNDSDMARLLVQPSMKGHQTGRRRFPAFRPVGLVRRLVFGSEKQVEFLEVFPEQIGIGRHRQGLGR